MLVDYELSIARSNSGASKLILTVDPIYATCLNAMGTWNLQNVGDFMHTSGRGSSGARWFWDSHNNVIQLKLGWGGYEDKSDEEDKAKITFELYYYKADFLKLGDQGAGNYYDKDAVQSDFNWKVVKIGAVSKVQYPNTQAGKR